MDVLMIEGEQSLMGLIYNGYKNIEIKEEKIYALTFSNMILKWLLEIFDLQ